MTAPLNPLAFRGKFRLRALRRRQSLLAAWLFALPSLVLPALGAPSVVTAPAPEVDACALTLEVAPPVERWSFKGARLKLRLDQLLPVDYLADLTAGVGAPRLVFEQKPTKIAFKVMAAADVKVARFELFPAKGRTDALMVEQLRLENPLSSRENTHLSQYKKGLPGDVFRYARNQIYEIAKAGGYDYISTGGAQNYAVAMLYRRVVGMKPVTPKGEVLFSKLDALFFKARKLVPEPFKIESLDDFSATIGDYTNMSKTKAAQEALDSYNQSGRFPSDVQAIESDGEVLGFIIPSDPPALEKSVFFLDPLNPRQILQWKTYNHDPAMALQGSTDR